MMDTLSAVVVIGLLSVFFVFGLIGYLRGKKIRSCCDLPAASQRKESAK